MLLPLTLALLLPTLPSSDVLDPIPPDPTRAEVDERSCTAACLTLGVCVGLSVCTTLAATGPANALARDVLQIGEPVQPAVSVLAIAATVPVIGAAVGLVDATVAHQQGPDIVPWLPPTLAGAAAALGIVVVGVPLVAATFFSGYAVIFALPAMALAVTGVGAWFVVSAPAWARHEVARPRGPHAREAPPLWQVPPRAPRRPPPSPRPTPAPQVEMPVGPEAPPLAVPVASPEAATADGEADTDAPRTVEVPP